MSGLAGHSDPIDFVINGAPFSGTGFGFNPSTVPATGPVLIETEKICTDTSGSDILGYTALLPNASAHDKDDPLANEDYDAVDFQNLLLALQVPVGENKGISVPIPSMHRPALVQYWMNRLAQDATNFAELNAAVGGDRVMLFLHPEKITDPAERERVIDVKRKILLRPLAEDHPNFDGGNPTVDTVTGTVLRGYNPLWDGQFADTVLTDGVCDFRWDVDNDGDGVEDSIWVDLGLPLQQTKDGRLVKPLVAILCVDMDGRLNVNAHGNLSQFSGGAINYYQSVPAVGALPRGQGYGSADVNLLPLFMDRYAIPTPDTNPDRVNITSLTNDVLPNYAGLLVGNAASLTLGRYGDVAGTGRPGLPIIDDYLSQNEWFNYSSGYCDASIVTEASLSTILTGYGTPPDIDANGVVYLDMEAAPYRIQMGQNEERIDDAYEVNLNTPHANDMLFTPVDLETVLRSFDVDSEALESRLLDITYDVSLGRSVLFDNRNEITTESWDLPCPNFVVPELVSGNKCRSLAEVLVGNYSCSASNLSGVLSPEVRAGLRMNLNCPLGNGRDDDGNGVVDEPGENEAATNAVYVYPPGPRRPSPSTTITTERLVRRFRLASWWHGISILFCIW